VYSTDLREWIVTDLREWIVTDLRDWIVMIGCEMCNEKGMYPVFD